MLALKQKLEGLHPKVSAFIRNEILTGVPEGTVIEMKVTKPGAETKITNLKVTQEDLEVIEELKKIKTF
ncbi:MAG: hypothetical protein K6G03_05190 [Lachnospiraceae bacterium]|nr:hypothetical protein [Lachnospiraceae bacterium]